MLCRCSSSSFPSSHSQASASEGFFVIQTGYLE
jgi:hypothetical protein